MFPEFSVLTVIRDLYNFLLLSSENLCLLLLKPSWQSLWCLKALLISMLLVYWLRVPYLMKTLSFLLFLPQAREIRQTPWRLYGIAMNITFMFWERLRCLYLGQPLAFSIFSNLPSFLCRSFGGFFCREI